MATIIILIMSLPGVSLAEPTESNDPNIDIRDEELLETDLPTTQHSGELDISIRPSSGDIIREDFIRMPIQFKYGINENWQVSVTPLTFFDNFFRGYFGLYITDLTLGTKYNFGETYPRSGVDMAISFSHILPIRYDTRISDGFYHYLPGILFSTRIWDKYNLGLGFGLNIVQGEGPAGSVRPKDVMSVSASILHKSEKLITYTVESIYASDEMYGGQTEVAYLTPGFSMDVKDWLKDVPGVWTLSSGLRIGLMDATEEFEVIVRLKVHIRFDYRANLKSILPSQEKEIDTLN